MSQQGAIDPAVQAGIFTKDALADLSHRLGEPQWMMEKRQAAWSLFDRTPMPTTRDEGWRRTDIRPIKWRDLCLSGFHGSRHASATRRSKLVDLPEPVRSVLDGDQGAAGRLALLNGHVVWHQMDEELRRQGVIFTDMTTAVGQHPDLVQQHFMTGCVTAGDGKFAALHGAFWDAGTFIYVPEGVEIGQPFQVVVAMEGEGTTVFPHTLIVAEHSSGVTCIEESLSLGGAQQALSNGVVEIIAGDEARMTYVDIQRWGDHVLNFNTRRAMHSPDSRVVWEMGQLGGRLTRTHVSNVLAGNGSSAEFNAVYFVSNKQHVDLSTMTHHIGLGTSADLLIKGAAKDRGRAVIQGLINIAPGSQQTDSYLKNDNLLLSNEARIDSIPGLKIDANDVRASHGATVGRADEDHVFYLQSRGIPRNTAIQMITEGFFANVFDRMSQEKVREKLETAVAAKIDD
jgi:Fe-S cluster assembly protein SufD